VDRAILRDHSLNSREKDTGKVKFGQEILNATSVYFGEVSVMVILHVCDYCNDIVLGL